MSKRLSYAALPLVLTLLLASCAAVPTTVCPAPAKPPAPVDLGPSFLDEMRSFLSGSPPAQTASAPNSGPAKSASEPGHAHKR
jgi:hypothetical protein